MKKCISLILLAAIFAVFAPSFTAYAAATPSGIPFSDLENQIDDFMAQHIGHSTPGAAVVIVHEGEIIFSKGYGYADTAQRTPVDPAATVFEYGSIGKLFTWTAVMQLGERGLLDLDADVATYLPADFMAQMAFEMPFTMRHLLNHQAGFGEYLFDFVFDADTIPAQIELRDALLLSRPLQIHTPGTIAAYSNFGTALAGYVVANISGQSFAAFEMENILRPAGMENTLNGPDWLDNHAFLQTKATAHIPNGRGGFNEIFWAYFPSYPSGALNGTAHDLARFAMALTPPAGETGPLFDDADTLASLFTPSSHDHHNFPGSYHGFLRYISTVPAFGHGGDSIGFSTNMVVVPAHRFGIVVLTNAGGEVDVRMGLPALLLGDNFDQATPGTDDMPNAFEVEGTFIAARSLNGQFLEFLDFLAMLQLGVAATGEHEITIHVSGMGAANYARFIQVRPYVYQMIYASGPMVREVLSEQIHFRMEDGQPVQVHNGFIDFIEISTLRSATNLTASAVVAVGSIIFFLVMPIVLLVRFFLNKKKAPASSHFHIFRNGLILSGALLVMNNISSFVRILVISMYRTTAEIAPHIWINYIGLGLAAVFCAGALVYLREADVATRSKVLYFAATAITVMLVVVLVDWNFFILL